MRPVFLFAFFFWCLHFFSLRFSFYLSCLPSPIRNGKTGLVIRTHPHTHALLKALDGTKCLLTMDLARLHDTPTEPHLYDTLFQGTNADKILSSYTSNIHILSYIYNILSV